MTAVKMQLVRYRLFNVNVVMLILLAHVAGDAQEQSRIMCVPPIKQFAFADQLFAIQEYDLAALEYRRLIFHFPVDSLAIQAKYKLGLCYMGNKNWDEALKSFERIITKNNHTKLVEAALFNIATCYSQKGLSELAQIHYRKLSKQYPHSALADHAQLMLAFTYVDDMMWLDASGEFDTLVHDFPRSSLARLAGDLAIASKTGIDLPFRSNIAAGLLSAVLPGAGQVWCGRIADGIFSFLLTTTFTYLAVKSYNKNNGSGTYFLGFLGFSFYLGNIYGAVNAAKKFNDKHIEQFQNSLKLKAANTFR